MPYFVFITGHRHPLLVHPQRVQLGEAAVRNVEHEGGTWLSKLGEEEHIFSVKENFLGIFFNVD